MELAEIRPSIIEDDADEIVADKNYDFLANRSNHTDEQLKLIENEWLTKLKEMFNDNNTFDKIPDIDPSSLNEKQKLVFDIVSEYLNKKKQLLFIVNGTAGTGKSYTIYALSITHISIDEYSMLSQNIFGLIDQRPREATGNKNELFGGISIILTGDPEIEFKDAIRFFPDNATCNNYNNIKLKNTINVAINARITLTTNLWTRHGLVNGANGIIRDIVYPLNKNISLPSALLIDLKICCSYTDKLTSRYSHIKLCFVLILISEDKLFKLKRYFELIFNFKGEKTFRLFSKVYEAAYANGLCSSHGSRG
ncbi:ATP-dependent DNA helicase PIF1 [Brachionus plicatilis]|uniref:ATP-dependent DNA helicase PIF1 n=1 Tax=Brachionus plicatilis TaxID=10195 RepID=A0A3M7RVZ7_BRAPC|nr:ATP-dependent DNA helicase PIF1 [Brachionus plicatilis]